MRTSSCDSRRSCIQKDRKGNRCEIHVEPQLSDDQKQKLESLLKKHQNIFSKYDTDIGHCDKIKNKIDLSNEIPFKQPHRSDPKFD